MPNVPEQDKSFTDSELSNLGVHEQSNHEQNSYDHSHEPVTDDEAYWAQKTQTIQKLLEKQGYFTAAEVRREMERQDSVTPMLGARLVARVDR
ncbi:MAG: hypothetical protein AAFV90_26980 [Cyanobacteria bacterium J06634_5]